MTLSRVHSTLVVQCSHLHLTAFSLSDSSWLECLPMLLFTAFNESSDVFPVSFHDTVSCSQHAWLLSHCSSSSTKSHKGKILQGPSVQVFNKSTSDIFSRLVSSWIPFQLGLCGAGVAAHMLSRSCSSGCALSWRSTLMACVLTQRLSLSVTA